MEVEEVREGEEVKEGHREREFGELSEVATPPPGVLHEEFGFG